ncbi:MAG: hypothetical protein QM535_14510 [Limnohabitans sp.]|nr:hypothetical protein [Limnohabitans sp.]
MDKINCVIYKDNSIDFISLNNNIPYKVSLEDESENEVNKLTPIYEFDKYSQVSEKVIKSSKLIKTEDIQSVNIKTYIKNKKIELVDDNKKKVFSLFNNQIVMVEYYSFEDFFDNTIGKDVKGWHLTSTEFDYFYLVNLGQNKSIMMIGNENGYIIPTRKKTIIKYRSEDFTNGKIVNYNEKNLLENIKDFEENDFYKIHKTRDNKRILKNIFGDVLLEKKYDSIYIDQNYIIAKTETICDVYNTRLDKFNIKDLKAAYPRTYPDTKTLQVLANKEVFKVNFLNQEVQKEKLIRSGCGNLGTYSYSFEKNKFLDNTIVTEEHPYNNRMSITIIKKINLDAGYGYNDHQFDSIRFLNNLQTYKFNELDYYDKYETITLPREWLIVSKNGKYGVFEFNTKSELRYDVKEIIPIEYDSIQSFGVAHPLKLCKNNLYTYYGINNKKYKELDKFQIYFCRFKDEYDKTGWLDYRGNEYFD